LQQSTLSHFPADSSTYQAKTILYCFLSSSMVHHTLEEYR
jgi:hypothetical protein